MILAQFNLWVAEIRNDRARGASELARRALELLAEAARTLPAVDALEVRIGLSGLADALSAARPSMAPIGNLLRRWRDSSTPPADSTLAAARELAAEGAEALIAASRRAVTECAAHAARLLGPGRTVMTHSLSSTVMETCRLLKDDGLRMIVTEARPLGEGRQLVERLSAWRVPTTCITDAQMGLFVAQADAVLVGADSVLADGTVVNKAGTYPLALAARDRGVPFHVCCESFKWRAPDQPAPELEEMAAAELGMPDWPAVTVRNVYFDLTPARLVSAWIDETGARRPPAEP
ncbi:MAG: translation initiation factor eIF-2B [Candidatus Contendobacter sp.]|nr:translation initiation factor eIF-2B [Candidatus Contendobacter sp.]MDG4558309.1 translation initiation factor eIF-2B [Candidatus Contendobacter sp.]